jgi:uncharacterized RmlC-like cupin family protein
MHVPANLPHMQINCSDLELFVRVVVRSTPNPIVVNLADDTCAGVETKSNATNQGAWSNVG